MRVRLLLLAGVVILAGIGSATVGYSAGTCGPSYTVKAGDSLGRIAKRCDTDLREIMALNGMTKSGHLSIGQVLKMRDGAPVPASVTAVASGPMELTGEIVNGRWCAKLRTEDGQIFGVVSPKVSFRSGAVVRVQGQPVSGERCLTEQTLVVTDLTPVGQ